MITNKVTIPVDFLHKSANKTVPVVYAYQFDTASIEICIEAYYDGRNYILDTGDNVVLTTKIDSSDITIEDEGSFRNKNKAYFDLNYVCNSVGEYDYYFLVTASSARIGVKAFKLVVIPCPLSDVD